ncbi:MAG: hypothetical protein JW904_06220 [Spirochaetales bacterium]|nr:hypothetical protein [Spirochaetales bacterium]
MADSFMTISEQEFEGSKGDVLFLNLNALKTEYDYIGFWYACDKNEDTYISTDFYFDTKLSNERPAEKTEVIAENSYKRSPRKEFSGKYESAWVACHRDETHYCKMRAFEWLEEKSFINFKVIRNKGTTFDTLKTGILKGDTARFCKVGIEDGTGAVDYNDTIFFLVLIKSLPPGDWHFDPSLFGIQKLPMVVPTFNFSVLQKYSPWYGQNPLEGL